MKFALIFVIGFLAFTVEANLTKEQKKELSNSPVSLRMTQSNCNMLIVKIFMMEEDLHEEELGSALEQEMHMKLSKSILKRRRTIL